MTEKMPDAVRVWKNGRLYCRDYNDMKEPIHSHNAPIEDYLRAEPVEALLRQAREALIKSRAYAIGGKDKDAISLNAVTAIDEFLGENK